jgi:hypothetical protein
MFSGMWCPFGANPFSSNLMNQNIDISVGLTSGYNIIGSVSTPNALSNNNTTRLLTAFDNRVNIQNNKSGALMIWNGENPNLAGSSYTGYAGITPNQPNLSNLNNSNFAIRNNKLSNVTGNSIDSKIEGSIPGDNGNSNTIDFNRLGNGNRVNFNINSNKVKVVGASRNGQIRANGGGLIEMIWPLNDKGNFATISNNPDDVNKKIIDSYPPGYANVYLVPDSNNSQLRIFAVGKYSGQKVSASELLSASNLSQLGIPYSIQNNDIVINLSNLTQTQRRSLSTLYVNGGNVVFMPNSNGNGQLSYRDNQGTQQNFDLTVVATRFNNTDNFVNRTFYQDSDVQGIDRNIGGWTGLGNTVPNDQEITLRGGNGGLAAYVLPSSTGTVDRRRQVVRALEGNVIFQNFYDSDFNGVKGTNENIGYVGFSRENNGSLGKNSGGINVIAHNFVVLNYQGIQGNQARAGLRANIVTYRGALQIIDDDIYRFLLDKGRYSSTEYRDRVLPNVSKDANLYWYGRYVSYFASVEGVLDNGNIIGFSNTTIEADNVSNLVLPKPKRQDFVVNIGQRRLILYDVASFQINK